MSSSSRHGSKKRRATANRSHTDEPEAQNTHSIASGGDETPPPVGRTDLPEHRSPKRFGRYRILRRLGSGGMGTVYLAHDGELDRNVALKVPRAESARGEALARFRREARAMAGIDHPNLCTIYDFGIAEGRPYFTMAYVKGRPLSNVDSSKTSQRKIARIINKIAEALAAAHQRGVVHRDLKPSNILVDRRGEPVVVDFGLARDLENETQKLTQTGAILGTPAYMSPEHVRGDTDFLGPSADVYALGAVFYELLAGRPAFQGETASILRNILDVEPERPSSVRPGVDERLEAICLKAMAKSPEDRYAGMAELAADLQSWLDGEEMSIPQTPVLSPTSVRPRQRRRRSRLSSQTALWIGIAGAAGVIALGAVLLVVVNSGEKPRDSVNTAHVDNGTKETPQKTEGEDPLVRKDNNPPLRKQESPLFRKTENRHKTEVKEPDTQVGKPVRKTEPVGKGTTRPVPPPVKRKVTNRLTVNGREVVWKKSGPVETGRVEDKFFVRIPASLKGDTIKIPNTGQFRVLSAILLMNGRSVSVRQEGDIVLLLPKSQRSQFRSTTVMLQLQ